MRTTLSLTLAIAAALAIAPAAFAGDDAAPAKAPVAAESAPAPEAPAAEAAPAPAAGSASFAGTWAADAKQCAVPQDEQGAPMILTDKGFDQHEAHCAFANVAEDGGAYKVEALCSVEGDEQPAEFTLKVNGDTLTMGDENGATDMVRCKS